MPISLDLNHRPQLGGHLRDMTEATNIGVIIEILISVISSIWTIQVDISINYSDLYIRTRLGILGV